MNNEELARRAVASKHWRWMPGMKVDENVRGYRVNFVWDDEDTEPPVKKLEVIRKEWVHDLVASEWLPDLDDPATLGCVVAMVERARGGPICIICEPHPDDGEDYLWQVRTPFVYGSGLISEGLSKKGALVAALEAAP